MSTQLTDYKPQQNNLINLENPTIIDTIKNSICKGASNEQLLTFLSLAKHFNLNPFNREIYFSSQIGVFVGVHGRRRIAERNPLYRGLPSSEIRENDEFEIDKATGKILKHTSGKNPGKVIGAWAHAKKEGYETTPVVVWLDEFKKDNPAWKGYAQDMIIYKAETRALRGAFGSDYQGITDIEPEDEFKINNRPTFEESHSPAIGAIDYETEFGLKTDQSEKKHPEKFVNQQQIARLFARASELKLSQNQVKDMLIEKEYISIDPEKNDYSTKTMKVSDYEAAYEALNDLSWEVNQTEKQQTLDIDAEQATSHL